MSIDPDPLTAAAPEEVQRAQTERLLEAWKKPIGWAAVRRRAALDGIAVLEVTSHVTDLARRLVEERALPPKAVVDALHIAVAAVNGMDYLLTWNCAHIANAATRGTIERTCRAGGSYRQ